MIQPYQLPELIGQELSPFIASIEVGEGGRDRVREVPEMVLGLP